ncbi:MAG: type II toxin-antitoxin system RelE/ParE family toxin [Armatimonadota bacterium]|nr:type II toxin-antitoxin system RelE/ParE family toxin [Armatimonadota bacterium]
MSYRVLILRRAQKELSELPAIAYDRVREALLSLSSDPRPRQSRKLASRNGWRLRIGDYRVIYEINDADRTITILHVGHRRDVYS